MTTKYMVTSGFLGSGKTTSMIAFADSINSRGLGSAAILANDLGAGNIVDAEFTATTGFKTLPISGNCICYQHENLVDKLHQLEAAGADIIFSD
ncbi:MAG: CobW-like GTP-binding protein, partial [Clostridiales bacterium]|nr:CobW-like GTP-binding protein [Clostridiales bacterium]